MTSYKVLKISNNLEKYPECKKDTEMYPYIIKHLNDEMDIFIIQDGTDIFWEASEFFHMVNFNYFSGE